MICENCESFKRVFRHTKNFKWFPGFKACSNCGRDLEQVVKEAQVGDHRNTVGDALEKFVERPRDTWTRGILCSTIGYLIGHFILWAFFGFPVAGR